MIKFNETFKSTPTKRDTVLPVEFVFASGGDASFLGLLFVSKYRKVKLKYVYSFFRIKTT